MYETERRNVKEWINEIDKRHLVLPRFQRLEAWEPQQVQELMQSIIDQLPIGSILLLQVGDEIPFSYRTLPGAPQNGDRIREFLLDGQQRLTALWKALNDNYEWLKFFIQIEADKWTEEDNLPIVRRVHLYPRNGIKYPLWTKDDQEIWQRGLIPISLFHPDADKELEDWTENVAKEGLAYYRKLSQLKQKINQFEIPYIALKPEASPDAVITAFTKLNTQATPLSAFDLVVARMEANDIDLHKETDRIRKQVPALSYFEHIDDLDLLRSVVLLEDQVPTQGNILKLRPDQIKKHWDKLIEHTKRALDFVQEECIFDAQRLPVERILPALFALWTYVPEGGIEEGDARKILRKYLWRAFLSDRYERGGMTPLLHDFRALRELLQKDEGNVPCFDPEQAPLPQKPEELLFAGSPKKRSRMARALLCMSFRKGAKDIHDGKPITKENIREREYHHLFPKPYLEEHYPNANPDIALNFALVTWRTNRSISAKSPKIYLEEATKREGGRDELTSLLKIHLVPIDPFFAGDYEEFLTQRAQLFFDGIQNITEGKDW